MDFEETLYIKLQKIRTSIPCVRSFTKINLRYTFHKDLNVLLRILLSLSTDFCEIWYFINS
jgi:hypothetical protein